MNNNIDISRIKIVIFDFDGTLAIHEDKDFNIKRKESKDKFWSFYEKAYKFPDTFYEEIEPCTKSDILYNFINKLRNMSIKMYCLSGMKFSFHLKAKQSFVNKHYGNDIEVIATSNQELKLDGVKIIQRLNNCNLDEILFIDDMEETINYLNDNGVKTINVNDIK